MAYLALDLGAGSGRAIVGTIKNGKIEMEEVHRFTNHPVKIGDTLYWDFPSLFSNIKQGISIAIKRGYSLRGLAVDTWGVDYGLLDNKGRLLSNPVCYRDCRTSDMSDRVEEIVSKERLYEKTGIQQMEINTMFQLFSQQETEDPTLECAEKLLFTPDLINYFLTGIARNEYTIASTSQLLNATAREWDTGIFEKFALPYHLMQKIINPGSLLGVLNKEIADQTGVGEINVFSVGSHDTASAIAAIPEEGEEWAFLSSGTWSLLGILSDYPILDRNAMQNDFTNEGGVDDKILFMRNITGLWLLQRLMAEWEKEGEDCSYDFLLSECSASKPFGSVVNSDHPSFVHPASMTEAIQTYCKQTKQTIPQTKGEYVRCVLESLAVKYYFVIDKLKECTGRNITKLHIVGGGSQNELLNQYIADALNICVTTGLTEATAVGNIIQQAIADRRIENWAKGHEIIKNSFNFKIYQPSEHNLWTDFIIQHAKLFE